MDAPAMTMVEALGDVPAFIHAELGERVLERCIQDSGLSENLLSSTGGYIPEVAVARFFDSAARRSGDPCFGAHIAWRLSVRDYGVFGDYVLEAPTLGEALERAVSVIHLHAKRDELSVSTDGSNTRLCYVFAERGTQGYQTTALAAAGVLLSIPRHYLGASWKPVSLGFDLPASSSKMGLESSFGCDVKLGRPCIELEIANCDLVATNPGDAGRFRTTIFDVHRACSGGPPKEFTQVVATLLRNNLGIEQSSLEDIAHILGVGSRTLQRRLDLHGTSFREVASRVKMNRGAELLLASPLSLDEIAFQLDYSTSSHFSRAFRRFFDVSPDEYRKIYCN